MIHKFSFSNLRNAEYYQFIRSVNDILFRFGIDRATSGYLYDLLDALLKIAETAMIAERRSEKVREKNELDRYRDRLHSKLFNHLKAILCDEKDPRFDDAQLVMNTVKEAGNPTQLSENAQSAMMTALGNRLQPYRDQLETTGTLEIVDNMLKANEQFIAVETEYRTMLAAQKLEGTPTSMTAVRKQTDSVYRDIVNAINGYCGIPAKKEEYRELVTEMNVLVARYDAILAARKSVRNDQEQPAEE